MPEKLYKWVAIMDNRTCEVCRLNNNRVISEKDLEEVTKSITKHHEVTNDPENKCRCVLREIVDGDEQLDELSLKIIAKDVLIAQQRKELSDTKDQALEEMSTLQAEIMKFERRWKSGFRVMANCFNNTDDPAYIKTACAEWLEDYEHEKELDRLERI